ncbi:HAD-IIA family hydrolase [Sneathiella chungangensis]|uniref:HAD-IIA family hydrolase n=1 Tax=Sneathiella chungangensis TaxID=1418234 RepID=A0A845MJD2_9PROT|nr:HAD-IIA family hydrolase [Sneathiella chungangensis]MZR23426.1 HAD-IIA family hydrolase [Sneathiella chungangensis]
MTLPNISAAEAFARYEAIRSRLPVARFPAASKTVENLAALAEEIDVFLLDAFGVLNVGERAIAGAKERLEELSRLGKQIFVITNGATYGSADALRKYRALGFDFAAAQVISSRDIASAALEQYSKEIVWGVAATAQSGIAEMPFATRLLSDDPQVYDAVDGFLFLSAAEWSASRQALLSVSLRRNPRPFIVGNPDLVAPREEGLSLEPGFFAHEIADTLGIEPLFYGKPYANVFERAIQAALAAGADRRRIAMVGDTLHTDILGGAAAGLRTVLITDHGLYKGMDVAPLVANSGIVPDFIAATT